MVKCPLYPPSSIQKVSIIFNSDQLDADYHEPVENVFLIHGLSYYNYVLHYIYNLLLV